MNKFIIILGTNRQFYFKLIAGNNEAILSSEGYLTKQGCVAGIASVKANSMYNTRYIKRVANDGQYYFTLHGSNGQVIGVSEMYHYSQSRDNGILSVKKNAPISFIDDRSMNSAA
jgi:uncharacterized protein YegP (UPF0339 family)